jgi:hypothetical protein
MANQDEEGRRHEHWQEDDQNQNGVHFHLPNIIDFLNGRPRSLAPHLTLSIDNIFIAS